MHLFPEGYVNLSRHMILRRFKWGVSRLLLESKARPRVVPIWIQGESLSLQALLRENWTR